MVRGEILVTAGDFVLDKTHDVCQRERPPAGAAGEGVCWHARSWRAAALGRAVRIRWGRRGGSCSIWLKSYLCI